MILTNPHIRKAIATERIADLRRDAAPRAEATAKTGRMSRRKRAANPAPTAPAVEAQPR